MYDDTAGTGTRRLEAFYAGIAYFLSSVAEVVSHRGWAQTAWSNNSSYFLSRNYLVENNQSGCPNNWLVSLSRR